VDTDGGRHRLQAITDGSNAFRPDSAGSILLRPLRQKARSRRWMRWQMQVALTDSGARAM